MPRRKQEITQIPADESDELIEIDESPQSPPEEKKEEVKVKKERKENPWISWCREVKARPENQGLSYREVLKKAKLEYSRDK